MALPIVEELVPAPDPAECCERLAGAAHRLFLDSAGTASPLGRHSFLCADPAVVLRGLGARSERLERWTGRTTVVAENVLRSARALLAECRTEPVPGLPPFQGGLAGYLGYELGRALERLPAPALDDLALPDAVLGLYDWVIAWDHAADRAWIVSTGLPATGADAERRARARLADVRRRLAGPPSRDAGALLRPRATRGAPPTYPLDASAAPLGLRSTFSREGYVRAVARVREYVHAGDIFQANLTQRLDAALPGDPWLLYRTLRARNPAPFAAYLELGDAAILSASPERFLRLDPDGAVETRPIKGTRPRGIAPEHDAALALALLESEKDRAENLMIVDLLRNDLSRVCRPGSVRATGLFAHEQYATVHHLVSTVVGRLEPGEDAASLLAATFPGGSITGAPKVRAMEIIAELEPTARGPYCGAIGYLGASGAMDTSIVIRTMVAAGGRAYFGVGGGIVADSDPADEYDETLHKARALIEALGAAARTRGVVPPSGDRAALDRAALDPESPDAAGAPLLTPP